MLSKQAKEKIRASYEIQGAIADAFAKSPFVFPRWIEENKAELETPAALQIIREKTGLSDEEILEPVTVK